MPRWHAETPACVVVNPDVELLDDRSRTWPPSCCGPARPDACSPRWSSAPTAGARTSVHPEPVSLAAALTALVPPLALPGALRRRLQPWHSNRPRAVAWAVGCAVGGRSETLRRLGPFDPRIFLYGEDMELGLRAGDAGIGPGGGRRRA